MPAERVQKERQRPLHSCSSGDDELFPREDGLALYDLLGSPEKTLHANPGGHIALSRAEVADIIQFVRRYLAGG